MKSHVFSFWHIFWFVLVLFFNLEDLYTVIKGNYALTPFNCFVTILGVFVLSYQIKLLYDDYQAYKAK